MRRNVISKICAATIITIALAHTAGCSADVAQDHEALSTSESALETQRVFGDEKGNIYVLTSEGDLLWYADTARNGTFGWGRGSGNRIGMGWTGTFNIFSGGNGHIYWVGTDGNLKWYRDDAANGNTAWDPNSGARVIGNGWASVKHAFSGGDGHIYVIFNDGTLRWYRHTGRSTGTYEWAAGSGNIIRHAVGDVKHAFTCQDGNIYTVLGNGDLVWYRDLARNGGAQWAVSSGTVIGTGWAGFKHLWCGGNGMIYGVDSAGALRWYRDTLQNGSWSWGPGSGNQIGSGWIGIPARSTAEYPTCSTDNDCPIRQECVAGKCRVDDQAKWCETQHSARNTRGDRVDCGAYACENGMCKRSCTTTDDCSDQLVGGQRWQCSSGYCSKWVSGEVIAGPGGAVLPLGVPYRETIAARGCATSAHCMSGDTCVHNACFTSVSLRCTDDRSSKVYWGTPYDCGAYACEPISGSCLYQCHDSTECEVGKNCDPSDHRCK